MADFAEVKIPVEWGHISGKWWGPKNIQPILATHGWLDNCGTFDTLAPILVSSETSILAIDLPGHGLSSHIPEGMYYYFFWDGVLNIRRIVKHFNWNKVRLMGHSLGGAASMLYAGIYPDEVDFIVSLDIAGQDTRHLAQLLPVLGKQADRFLFNCVKEKTSFNGSYEKLVRLVQETYGGSITRTSTEILLRRALKPVKNQDVYYFTLDPRAKTGEYGVPYPDSCVEYAKRVKCGYLNIRAKKGVQVVYKNSKEAYDKVVDAIKKVSNNFQFVEIEGTHHVHLNEPATVAPIIQDFMKSYPSVKM